MQIAFCALAVLFRAVGLMELEIFAWLRLIFLFETPIGGKA